MLRARYDAGTFMTVSVQARENPRERKCPYCHDELRSGQMSYTCPSCEAIHHSECATSHRRCAVFGCQTPVALVAVPERTSVGLRVAYFAFALALGGIAIVMDRDGARR